MAAIGKNVNVWGTSKALIDEDEFCPECERENGLFGRRHYTICPLYPYVTNGNGVRV